MPLPDTLTLTEVNDAFEGLKACIDDAKGAGSFTDLRKHLPRLAYILRNDQVVVLSWFSVKWKNG